MKNYLVLLFLLCSDGVSAHNLSLKSWMQNQTDGVVRQTTDFSCGPAALSLLLKVKYGISVDEMAILSDILYRSGNGGERNKIESGFSLLDLKEESQRLGYNAKGVRFGQYEDVRDFLPIIVLFEGEKYSHFVVLTKIEHGYADVLDPQTGRLHMPLYQFNSLWKGYALITGGDYDN